MGLGFLLQASSRENKYLKETHCPCLLNSEEDHKIYSWSLLKPEHDLKLVQILLKLLRALPWSPSKQHSQFYRLLIWLLLCNLASHMKTSKAQEKQNTKEMGVAENAFSKCKHRSVNPALGISQICEVDKYFNGFVSTAEQIPTFSCSRLIKKADELDTGGFTVSFQLGLSLLTGMNCYSKWHLVLAPSLCRSVYLTQFSHSQKHTEFVSAELLYLKLQAVSVTLQRSQLSKPQTFLYHMKHTPNKAKVLDNALDFARLSHQKALQKSNRDNYCYCMLKPTASAHFPQVRCL